MKGSRNPVAMVLNQLNKPKKVPMKTRYNRKKLKKVKYG